MVEKTEEKETEEYGYNEEKQNWRLEVGRNNLMCVAGDATWNLRRVLPLGAMFESMALQHLGSVITKDQAMALVWDAAQEHVHV